MLFNNLMKVTFILSVLSFAGCHSDLNPSGTDERSVSSASVQGDSGIKAQNFTVQTTKNEALILEDELASNAAVVLYFTMWCPLCDSHMTSIRDSIKPQFLNVRFLIVDYVSGSVSQARSAQLSNGYAAETVLVDADHHLLDRFHGTMGSTIVIDSSGRIKMNEDYKASRLASILEQL